MKRYGCAIGLALVLALLFGRREAAAQEDTTYVLEPSPCPESQPIPGRIWVNLADTTSLAFAQAFAREQDLQNPEFEINEYFSLRGMVYASLEQARAYADSFEARPSIRRAHASRCRTDTIPDVHISWLPCITARFEQQVGEEKAKRFMKSYFRKQNRRVLDAWHIHHVSDLFTAGVPRGSEHQVAERLVQYPFVERARQESTFVVCR